MGDLCHHGHVLPRRFTLGMREPQEPGEGRMGIEKFVKNATHMSYMSQISTHVICQHAWSCATFCRACGTPCGSCCRCYQAVFLHTCNVCRFPGIGYVSQERSKRLILLLENLRQGGGPSQSIVVCLWFGGPMGTGNSRIVATERHQRLKENFLIDSLDG